MKKILFTGFMASILSIAGAYAVADNDGYLTTKSYVDDAAMWATKQGDWNATLGQKGYIANKPTLATVATSGEYSDLTGTPTNVSDFENDAGYITSAEVPAQVQADWTETNSTAKSYIANKPTVDAAVTTGSSNLISSGAVATAIANVPAQVNADWNATTGVSAIANKPTLADVATTGSYNDLTDIPDIPTSIADLGTCTNGTVCVIDSTGALVPVDTIDTWEDLL